MRGRLYCSRGDYAGSVVESVRTVPNDSFMDRHSEERKKRILAFLKAPSYHPMKEKELAIIMQVSNDDRKYFRICLEELVREGKISVSKRGRYQLSEKTTYTGIFMTSGRGFGFVRVEGMEDEFYISEKNTETAMQGDTVRIAPYNTSYGTSGGRRREAVVLEVLERASDCIVGTYDAVKERYGFVKPDSTKLNRDIFVSVENSMGAETGQKVVVRVTSYGDAHISPQGYVTEILGYAGDPGIDILSILKSYDMDERFPEEVVAEAKQIPDKVLKKDIKGREDLRDLDMVTIDRADTKDMDDAVSLTMDGEDYVLGVHIADVSHYVTEGSALDKEALSRATSCYPLDDVIPMLPSELSNGICSLNEKTDRLALSVFMTVTPQGEIADHRFAMTVINSNRRMNYDDVDKIITAHDEDMIEKYSDVADMLLKMNELALILRKRRKKRGSIDFGIPESKVELDDMGRAISVHPYERNNATKLIEDFMLAANETVAEHFFWADVPFVYRVHGTPELDKIRKLATFISNFGYGLKVTNDEIHPKEIQKLLVSIEDTPEEPMIATLTLRSMQRAKYSTSCEGHFGLALKYYCHFTSPIRRYPDLQIHRIIKEQIRGTLDDERKEHYKEILGDVCRISGVRERLADDAERECEALKKAEYMEDHIGEFYDGVISGVTPWGLYVTLPNTIEGLVHVSKITGDYYDYFDNTYELVGQATGKRYKLGMPIRVVCNMVDLDTHTIDFILADDASALDMDIY